MPKAGGHRGELAARRNRLAHAVAAPAGHRPVGSEPARMVAASRHRGELAFQSWWLQCLCSGMSGRPHRQQIACLRTIRAATAGRGEHHCRNGHSDHSAAKHCLDMAHEPAVERRRLWAGTMKHEEGRILLRATARSERLSLVVKTNWPVNSVVLDRIPHCRPFASRFDNTQFRQPATRRSHLPLPITPPPNLWDTIQVNAVLVLLLEAGGGVVAPSPHLVPSDPTRALLSRKARRAVAAEFDGIVVPFEHPGIALIKALHRGARSCSGRALDRPRSRAARSHRSRPTPAGTPSRRRGTRPARGVLKDYLRPRGGNLSVSRAQ